MTDGTSKVPDRRWGSVADPEPGDLDGPDFLVIGAPKGGTTSVRIYLDRHPDISIVVDPDVDSNHAAPGYFSNVLDEDLAAEEPDHRTIRYVQAGVGIGPFTGIRPSRDVCSHARSR